MVGGGVCVLVGVGVAVTGGLGWSGRKPLFMADTKPLMLGLFSGTERSPSSGNSFYSNDACFDFRH